MKLRRPTIRRLLRSWGRALGAGRSSKGRVIVRIDDHLPDMSFGWGPEIDDLADRLASVAAQAVLGELESRRVQDGGFELIFISDRAHALAARLNQTCDDSPMQAMVRIWLVEEVR